MKKRIHIFYTIFISLISIVLNIFITIFITPRITNYVGIEAYGFVSLAKNFIAYSSIAMTAINSFAARYMSLAYLKKDYSRYKKYYNSVLISDFVIGGFIMLIGFLLTWKLEILINIPSNLIKNVKILFVFAFISFYITTISTVFLATGYIKEKLDWSNAIKAVSYILEIITLIICFYFFSPNVWYVGASLFIAALTIFIGSYSMTKKLIPESKLNMKCFSFNAVKSLVINGMWNSANSIGNLLNSGLDILVSNIMLNATAMGQISIAKTINNMLYTLYATFSQPFQPLFLKYYSSGDKESLLREMKYSMKVCGSFSNIIFIVFVVFGKEFLNLWIPHQDINTIYTITVISMLPCITEGCIYPLYYIYTLTLKNKIPCVVTILGGVINVVSMWILIKFTPFGLYSVVITTAVIMNFINLVTNPIYMCKCLKIHINSFYKDIFLNVFVSVFSIIVLSLVRGLFFDSNSWFKLSLNCIIVGILGLILQVLFLFNLKDLFNRIKMIKLLKKSR